MAERSGSIPAPLRGRPSSPGVLIPPHFQPSRPSCATRGRADKPQRGEQAGIPGRGQPQQGEATPPSAARNHATTESATDCAAAPRSCRHISARPRARRPALPEPDSCVAAPNFGFATKRAAGPNPVTRPGTAARWTGSAGTQHDARAGLRPGHGLAPESIRRQRRAGSPPVSTSRSVAGPVWRLTTVSAVLGGYVARVRCGHGRA